MVQKLDSAVHWNRMAGVIACREESDFGSLFISGRFDFRLDEPAATRRHSIFSWGKSRSARTDGKRALRFTDAQRRRFAATAKKLSCAARKFLSQIPKIRSYVAPSPHLCSHV